MRWWWLGLSVISARKEREIINYISSAAPTCWFLLLLRFSYLKFIFFLFFFILKKIHFKKEKKKYNFIIIIYMWRSLKCSHSRTHIRVPKQFIDPLSVNFNLKNSNEIKCASLLLSVWTPILIWNKKSPMGSSSTRYIFITRGIDPVIIIF